MSQERYVSVKIARADYERYRAISEATCIPILRLIRLGLNGLEAKYLDDLRGGKNK